MLRTWKIAAVVVVVGLLMSTAALEVFSQSATRGNSKPPAAAAQGSAQKTQPGSDTRAMPSHLAMEGYCPVCIMEMKKWVMGKPEINASYQGRTYYFPGEKQKKMFEANPAKYAPALGGDCTVCKVEMDKQVPGSIAQGLFYQGHLYFFASTNQKKMFSANPAKYALPSADAKGSDTRGAEKSSATKTGSDTKESAGSASRESGTAFGGYCPVCLKEMQKWVPGTADFQVTHKGQTYLFPGEKQRQMFLANPAKYAPVLDGECAVCRVEMNERVPGSVRYTMYHKGQLYLFPGEKQKAMFAQSPEKYEVPAADQAEIR